MPHKLTSAQEAEMPKPWRFEKFRIVLIKPSKYDDDGYLIRFWKGVLPSNTLNVLHGLTDDVKERCVFGDLSIEVTTFDETAEKVPIKKIIRWSRKPRTKLLVCLVGVQTNQFPRALDMARLFRAEDIAVIIGGFHTSGTINMLGEQEPDIQELVRESICVVSGEVEGKWEMILSDFLHDQLKPIYSFAQDLQSLVDIESSPLPKTSPKTMEHFAYPTFGTADTSRGCPFACSFCTIINVQGRKMRERSPESIAALLRRNYSEHGVSFYFFTDDNFARKKLWRETFEAIIKLRQEGIKVSFMMQVDLARKPKDFVSLAAKAGCTQVFIGMESVNPENLKAEGKKQNNVEEYRDMIKVLSRWSDNAKNYWNLMSVFFWYKNAALIEKQHPMVAGFFRLKDRKARRAGYAIDSLPMHAWKRAKEITQLLISWAKFMKEMEEVWLQTRKKSETEEKWLEQIQRVQGDVWQDLRIGELQRIYTNAKEALPEKARALLDPLEELSSKILWTRKDLNRFLKQWESLRGRIQELRLREGDAARRWLDEMYMITDDIRLGERIHDLQYAYGCLSKSLPSKARLRLVKCDTLNNGAIYS